MGDEETVMVEGRAVEHSLAPISSVIEYHHLREEMLVCILHGVSHTNPGARAGPQSLCCNQVSHQSGQLA